VAVRHGRSWRAALGSSWERHRYDGVDDKHVVTLAYLRNTRGPNWLVRFRFPKD
jgi:hypothetical protein